MSPLAPGTTSGVFEQEERRAMAINRRRLIQSFALTGGVQQIGRGSRAYQSLWRFFATFPPRMEAI